MNLLRRRLLAGRLRDLKQGDAGLSNLGGDAQPGDALVEPGQRLTAQIGGLGHADQPRLHGRELAYDGANRAADGLEAAHGQQGERRPRLHPAQPLTHGVQAAPQATDAAFELLPLPTRPEPQEEVQVLVSD